MFAQFIIRPVNHSQMEKLIESPATSLKIWVETSALLTIDCETFHYNKLSWKQDKITQRYIIDSRGALLEALVQAGVR